MHMHMHMLHMHMHMHMHTHMHTHTHMRARPCAEPVRAHAEPEPEPMRARRARAHHTPQSFHDVYFHGNTETGQLRSLWLCQIDPRIALVLIFAERKRAKDSSVLAFLRQICEGLRGQGILEHSLLQ